MLQYVNANRGRCELRNGFEYNDNRWIETAPPITDPLTCHASGSAKVLGPHIPNGQVLLA